MPVRLQLLGSPSVEADGQAYAFPFERRSQLIAFLALKRAWVGRAELAAMLWPEQDSKLAYTNLRKTLFRLQSQPWAKGVETQGASLRFDAATDVARFESALRDGRLDEALQLHRGPLLVGFDDGQSEAWTTWLAFERERLRGAWRSASLSRLAAGIEPREAVELAARLLEDDPLDEAAMRAYVLSLGRDGQAAQARQAYREFTARLSAELGLAAGSELQSAYESVMATPLAAPAVAPPADDGFVGRAAELRELTALLARSDVRLVSLVGPGGVGKTRLARRMAAEAGGAFVALDNASDANDIAAAISRGLGLASSGRRDPVAQLLESLQEHDNLLVLDNFEHLTAQIPLVSQILDECPRLKILITSRARLGIAAEHLMPIEGLPCPDPEDEDHLESFDAARLFIKAAKRVEPGLVPDADAASIVEICRLVEGLPLALELAASWTRVMSCEAIARQLREGEQLLEAADAAQPARHASMGAVFEQSWRLLAAVEREALARASVFRGGFSVEAAKSVAGAWLPVLGALVDKSLLRKGRTRLHMHPLVHHFAAARLEASSAHDSTRRAHALYFHEVMARLRRGIEDGNREALQAMELEWQNCRAAWRWSLTNDMRDAVVRGMPALLHFCDHRFRLNEALALLREALDSPAVRADPGLESLILGSVAHMEYRQDRYADAEAHAKRALANTGTFDDHATKLQCFKVLGSACLRMARFDEARDWFKQALKQAPASIDPNNAASMLDNLALVEKHLGRYAESLKMSQKSLMQHRVLGDVAGEALCLNNLADLYMVTGDNESARKHLEESLVLCERHGLDNTRAIVLANLSEIALKDGDVDLAGDYAQRALQLVEANSQRGMACWIRIHSAEIALRRDDIAGARANLAGGMQLAIATSRPGHQFLGLSCFARIIAAQGEAECAHSVLEFCLGHPALPAPERDHVRRVIAEMPKAATKLKWPGIALDELVNRVVVEAGAAHAPLIAELRG